MTVPKILDESRVASASIRGYLAQAYVTVLQWLDLAPNELLLCEGNEDIDRLVLDNSGKPVESIFTQVKDVTSRLSARDSVVRESICNFLLTFHSFHNDGHECAFVFRTTAAWAKQRIDSKDPTANAPHLTMDVLASWSSLPSDATDGVFESLRRNIVSLCSEPPPTRAGVVAAINYLDSNSAWPDFLQSVSWLPEQPDVAETRQSVLARLSQDARTRHLPPEVLASRLLSATLEHSTRLDAKDRVLRPSDIQEYASLTISELREWNAQHPGMSKLLDMLQSLDERVGNLEALSDPCENLKKRTVAVLAELSTHTSFRVHGTMITIERLATEEVVKMATLGHVAVVGGPGAGKSALMYNVATRLAQMSADVVALTADGLSLDTIENLPEALRSWSGDGPAYLLLDALDSPHDEVAASRLRGALGVIMAQATRWKVVASVRTFDLAVNPSLADLFPGAPHLECRDASLPLVHHFKLDRLSDAELLTLKPRAPMLYEFAVETSEALRELLQVPFNLRLAAHLIEDGLVLSELRAVRTQVQLLEKYWARRVGEPSTKKYVRESLVDRVVATMVDSGRLRIATSLVSMPEALTDLLSAEVLVHPSFSSAGVADKRLISFKHRLLFDYALARGLPPEHDDFVHYWIGHEDLGLLSRLGLEMYFELVWESDSTRAQFWDLATKIEASAIRDIGKVIAPTVASRLAAHEKDVLPLLSPQGRAESDAAS